MKLVYYTVWITTIAFALATCRLTTQESLPGDRGGVDVGVRLDEREGDLEDLDPDEGVVAGFVIPADFEGRTDLDDEQNPTGTFGELVEEGDAGFDFRELGDDELADFGGSLSFDISPGEYHFYVVAGYFDTEAGLGQFYFAGSFAETFEEFEEFVQEGGIDEEDGSFADLGPGVPIEPGETISVSLSLFEDEAGVFGIEETRIGIHEDFEDGVAENWVPDSDRWSVSDGKYVMDGDGRDGWAYSYYDADFADFTLSAEVSNTAEGHESFAHGIYFRSPDGEKRQDAIVFTVAVNGLYWVGTLEDGEEDWTGWLSHDAINEGVGAVNHLRVEAEGSSVDFYINDTYIRSMDDVAFDSGKVGVHGFDEDPDRRFEYDNVVLVPGTP